MHYNFRTNTCLPVGDVPDTPQVAHDNTRGLSAA